MSVKEDINESNTISYINFTQFKQQVFTEINKLRTDPKSYASFLEKLMSHFNEDRKSIKFYNEELVVEEGYQALEECFQFLLSIDPVHELIYKQGMELSADDLIKQVILNEGNSSILEDEILKNINLRLNKYGVSIGEQYEIMNYNSVPQLLVLNFIICDGDLNRTERGILFSPNIGYCGISSDYLPSDSMATVINFSSFYYQKGDKVPKSFYFQYKDLFDKQLKKTTSDYCELIKDNNIETPQVDQVEVNNEKFEFNQLNNQYVDNSKIPYYQNNQEQLLNDEYPNYISVQHDTYQNPFNHNIPIPINNERFIINHQMQNIQNNSAIKEETLSYHTFSNKQIPQVTVKSQTSTSQMIKTSNQINETRGPSHQPKFDKISATLNTDGSKNLETKIVQINMIKSPKIAASPKSLKSPKSDNSYNAGTYKQVKINKEVNKKHPKYNILSYEDRFWTVIKRKPEKKNPESRRNINSKYIKNPFENNYGNNNQTKSSEEIEKEHIQEIIEKKQDIIYKLRQTEKSRNNKDASIEEKSFFITHDSIDKDKIKDSTLIQNTNKQATMKQNTIKQQLNEKAKRIPLNTKDYINFITNRSGLYNVEQQTNNIIKKILLNQMKIKLDNITKAERKLTILSIDNRESYYQDLILLNELSLSEDIKIQIEYNILEEDTAISNIIKQKLENNMNFHPNITLNIINVSVESLLNTFSSEIFDVVVLNRCLDRVNEVMYSIPTIFNKFFRLLNKKSGELIVFDYEKNSRYNIREAFNQYKNFNNSNILSASDIYSQIIKNSDFDTINDFLVGYKKFDSYINLTSCCTKVDKEAISLMSRFSNQRIIDMNDIKELSAIMKSLCEEKNNSFILHEQISGFFFKRKSEKEEEEALLPDGVERMVIIEKPEENHYKIHKTFFYSDGIREVIEFIR